MAEPSFERRALLASIAVTAALGVLGVVWGIVSGSQMILLDGAFAIIGILLSVLLLRAATLSSVGPTRRYQYGQEGATPLVIAVQGLVLVGTLLYAGFEAVVTIREGGSTFEPGWAVLYAAITTSAGIGFWVWLRGRAAGSDLVTAESTAWRVASLRGVGMLVGFTIMWALVGSRWDDAVPYVDPAMVLVTCAVFVWAPIGMVRGTVAELLEGAPPDEVQARIHAAMEDVRLAYGIGTAEIRVAKLGPKLYVEVEAPARAELTIATEHEARERFRATLDELPYEVWLTFELTPRRP